MRNRTPESFQDPTAFERRLIDAGRADRVPAGLEQHMAQALGGLPPLAAAHDASHAAAAGAHATRGMLFSPALVWGTLSAVVLIGVVSWRATSNPAPASGSAHATTATQIVRPSGGQAPLSSLVETPPSALNAARPAPRPAAPAAVQSSQPSRPSPADGLREELALLDGARSALAAHDGAHALRLLDQHSRRFSRGRLTPEADALRIDAWAQRGNAARAERLSRRFLERHPSHPLADHIANISNPKLETPER